MAVAGYHPLTGEPGRLPDWSDQLDFTLPLDQMVAAFPVGTRPGAELRRGEEYVFTKMRDVAVRCVSAATGKLDLT